MLGFLVSSPKILLFGSWYLNMSVSGALRVCSVNLTLHLPWIVAMCHLGSSVRFLQWTTEAYWWAFFFGGKIILAKTRAWKGRRYAIVSTVSWEPNSNLFDVSRALGAEPQGILCFVSTCHNFDIRLRRGEFSFLQIIKVLFISL